MRAHRTEAEVLAGVTGRCAPVTVFLELGERSFAGVRREAVRLKLRKKQPSTWRYAARKSFQ